MRTLHLDQDLSFTSVDMCVLRPPQGRVRVAILHPYCVRVSLYIHMCLFKQIIHWLALGR
jgi:hypothetical protein